MSFYRIRAVAVRIARQFRRDPRSLALLIVVPIVMLTLLAWIFRTDPRPAQVAVASDDPQAAAALVARLSESPRIRAAAMDEAAAREQLKSRAIDALLILPAHFAPNLTATQALTVVVEGSDPQRTGSVLSTISRALPEALFELAGLNGRPVTVDPVYIHGGPEYDRIDSFAPVYVAFFAFFFVYLLTSVSFLRERLQGSFERLIVSPIRRSEIVLGYMLGFGAFATLQTLVVVGYVVFVLRINHEGSVIWMFLITLILAIGAVNLGIALSAFARTELQVVQFIPLVIVPQVLLSGVIFRVDDLPAPLRFVARLMPLTYANDALRGVMLRGDGPNDLWLELGVLVAFAAILVLLGAFTLRHDRE